MGVSLGILHLNWSQREGRRKGKAQLPAGPSLAGKGQELQVVALLEMVQRGNLCTSGAFKNWNSFHYLHAHMRQESG